MAYHYYVKKQVDCLILEVGIGGRYDATNEVEFPLVTAVSHLALEHTDILGNTIEEIAYAKAGIFKVGSCMLILRPLLSRRQPGAQALTVRQNPKAEAVLQKEALIRGAPTFTVVPPMPILEDLQLGLSGELSIRRTNASLAVAVVNAFLASPRLTRAFLPYVEKQEVDYIAALKESVVSDASDVYTARPYPGIYEQALLAGIIGWTAYIIYPYLLSCISFLSTLALPDSVSLAVASGQSGLFELNVSRPWLLLGTAVLIGNYTFPLLFRPPKRVPQTIVQESLPPAVYDYEDLPEAFVQGLA